MSEACCTNELPDRATLIARLERIDQLITETAREIKPAMESQPKAAAKDPLPALKQLRAELKAIRQLTEYDLQFATASQPLSEVQQAMLLATYEHELQCINERISALEKSEKFFAAKTLALRSVYLREDCREMLGLN